MDPNDRIRNLDEQIARRSLRVAQGELLLARIGYAGSVTQWYSLIAAHLSVMICLAMALFIILLHFNIMAGERLTYILAITVPVAAICYILHWLSGFLGLIIGPIMVIVTFSMCFIGTDSLWVRASTAPYVVEYWNKHIRPMEIWDLGGFHPREIPFSDEGIFKQAEFAKKQWKETWRMGDGTIRYSWSDANDRALSLPERDDIFELQWEYFVNKIRDTGQAPDPKDAPVYMCYDNEYRWYADAPGEMAKVAGGNWVDPIRSDKKTIIP